MVHFRGGLDDCHMGEEGGVHAVRTGYTKSRGMSLPLVFK